MRTAIIALVSGIVGGFIGGFSKFFWEKWLPDRVTWRRDLRIEREKSLAQYGGPAVRAMHELQQRIYVMVFKHPKRFDSLDAEEAEYETESLAFLVAQCCARIEMLRGKMEDLDYAKLVDKLDPISRNLAAYGHAYQLHRLHQQEIAELMLIVNDKGNVQCMGYSRFITNLKADDTVRCWSRLILWARSILEHWPTEIRMLVDIQNALVDALDFLDERFRWIPKNKRERLSVESVEEALKSVPDLGRNRVATTKPDHALI
jgi:hypothetical protein